MIGLAQRDSKINSFTYKKKFWKSNIVIYSVNKHNTSMVEKKAHQMQQ